MAHASRDEADVLTAIQAARQNLRLGHNLNRAEVQAALAAQLPGGASDAFSAVMRNGWPDKMGLRKTAFPLKSSCVSSTLAPTSAAEVPLPDEVLSCNCAHSSLPDLGNFIGIGAAVGLRDDASLKLLQELVVDMVASAVRTVRVSGRDLRAPPDWPVLGSCVLDRMRSKQTPDQVVNEAKAGGLVALAALAELGVDVYVVQSVSIQSIVAALMKRRYINLCAANCNIVTIAIFTLHRPQGMAADVMRVVAPPSLPSLMPSHWSQEQAQGSAAGTDSGRIRVLPDRARFNEFHIPSALLRFGGYAVDIGEFLVDEHLRVTRDEAVYQLRLEEDPDGWWFRVYHLEGRPTKNMPFYSFAPVPGAELKAERKRARRRLQQAAAAMRPASQATAPRAQHAMEAAGPSSGPSAATEPQTSSVSASTGSCMDHSADTDNADAEVDVVAGAEVTSRLATASGETGLRPVPSSGDTAARAKAKKAAVDHVCKAIAKLSISPHRNSSSPSDLLAAKSTQQLEQERRNADAMSNAQPPDILAFIGEPGTGKSFMVNAVAKCCIDEPFMAPSEPDHALDPLASDWEYLQQQDLVTVTKVAADPSDMSNEPCAVFSTNTRLPHLGPYLHTKWQRLDWEEALETVTEQCMLPSGLTGSGVTRPPVLVTLDPKAKPGYAQVILHIQSEREINAAIGRVKKAADVAKAGDSGQATAPTHRTCGPSVIPDADVDALHAILGILNGTKGYVDVDRLLQECKDKLVPMELRGVRLLVFNVSMRHKGYKRFVRRILYRFTCSGHFGMVKYVELRVPSTRYLRLLDTGGWNAVKERYCTRLSAEALRDPRIAALVLVGYGRLNASEGLMRMAADINLVNRMAPVDGSAALRVLTANNYGKEKGEGRSTTWEEFVGDPEVPEFRGDIISDLRACWDFVKDHLQQRTDARARKALQDLGDSYTPVFVSEENWICAFRINAAPRMADHPEVSLAGFQARLERLCQEVREDFHSQQLVAVLGGLERMFTTLGQLVGLNELEEQDGAVPAAWSSASQSLSQQLKVMVERSIFDHVSACNVTGVLESLDVNAMAQPVSVESVRQSLALQELDVLGNRALNPALIALAQTGSGVLPDVLFRDAGKQCHWVRGRMAIVEEGQRHVRNVMEELPAKVQQDWQAAAAAAPVPHADIKGLETIQLCAEQHFGVHMKSASDAVLSNLSASLAALYTPESLAVAHQAVLAAENEASSLHYRQEGLRSSRINHRQRAEVIASRTPPLFIKLLQWLKDKIRSRIQIAMAEWVEVMRASLDLSLQIMRAPPEDLKKELHNSPVYQTLNEAHVKVAQLLLYLHSAGVAEGLSAEQLQEARIVVQVETGPMRQTLELLKQQEQLVASAQAPLFSAGSSSSTGNGALGPAGGVESSGLRVCAICESREFEGGRNMKLQQSKKVDKVEIPEAPRCRPCLDQLRKCFKNIARATPGALQDPNAVTSALNDFKAARCQFVAKRRRAA